MARILAIDDDRQLLKVYRRLLSGDHEVVLAEGGQAAIDILKDDHMFDLIISDVQMPCADGMRVYQFLREKRPGLERRVVFLSGGWSQDQDVFMSQVPNPKVAKPFHMDELRQAIRHVLTITPPPG